VSRDDLMALAGRVEACSVGTVEAVQIMRERIWDGCQEIVPPSTAAFALAAALRALAAQEQEHNND
jgi:hypothetical protein